MRERIDAALADVHRHLGAIQAAHLALVGLEKALADVESATAVAIGARSPGMEDVHEIVLKVCKAHAVLPAIVIGSSKLSHVVEIRHIAMSLARSLTPHTVERLGEYFCRHHGTILHAVRRVSDRMATDPAFAVHFSRIRAQCTPQPVTPAAENTPELKLA